MSLLRTSVVACWFFASCTASLASEDFAKTLSQHPVWIKCGLTWQRSEGDPDLRQTFAGATVLYFGRTGKFAMVKGLVLKRATRMMISEGDGEADFIGTWAVHDGTVQVSYRLVSNYKIARKVGEPEPEIPGPVEKAEIRFEHKRGGDKKLETVLQFQGHEYEIARKLPVSEMKDRLEIYEGTSAPKP